jgi:hypothetical protein
LPPPNVATLPVCETPAARYPARYAAWAVSNTIGLTLGWSSNSSTIAKSISGFATAASSVAATSS